jgi:hypothetical protein
MMSAPIEIPRDPSVSQVVWAPCPSCGNQPTHFHCGTVGCGWFICVECKVIYDPRRGRHIVKKVAA